MRRSLWLLALAALVAGALLTAPASLAHASASGHVVFVQTNNPDGNAIVAYERHADGTLEPEATYPTGGEGGRAAGATSDPLSSQNSLVYDATHHLLFAVNAGSNSVSVFAVMGDTLHLNQVISSGGLFPVSLAHSGNLLYVLNAGGDGNVRGFSIANGRLHPIDDSTRSLDLDNTNPPFFLASPAEVGFTPAGSQLVVTTKDSGFVEVFSVNARGLLSAHAVKNDVEGVPFAFGFDSSGQLVLVNAARLKNGMPVPGTGSVATFTINANGTLAAINRPVSDGQTAACWITAVRGFDYISNTGSGTISQYRVGDTGAVRLVNATAASGIAGTTDLATAGGFLYNVSGLSSSVEVFAVNAHGALTLIQTQHVRGGASQEGIVAI